MKSRILFGCSSVCLKISIATGFSPDSMLFNFDVWRQVMAIYVGNLSYKVSQEDLSSIFAEYGTVKRVQLLVDRETGRSRGFGFVEMDTDAEEDAAIDALDGAEWMGRDMKVNKARPREENRDRGDRRSSAGAGWDNRGTGSYGRY
jgi:RNA recognition motif-containing protein